MTQLYKKNGSVFIPAGITVEEVEKLKELHDNSTKAKELIKEMLSILPKENIEGIYEITEKAEEFIREAEK